MRYDDCPDCKRLTAGDCGKHYEERPRFGWVCPKCNRVYGPNVLECYRCNNGMFDITQFGEDKIIYA